jgi:CubicO group peptidase (beta-lactamase class C family)
VHCPLAGWSRFVAMQLAAARGSADFLSPASVARLHAPQAPEGYAMGWAAAPTPAGAGLMHFGSNTMWYVAAVIVPSANLAVLVVTNSGVTAAEQALNQVVLDLTDTYKPQ